MRPRFTPLLAALLITLWFMAFPTGAQTMVRPSGPAIAIDVSKGVLISLDRNADTVFVADPAIADVQVQSPRLI